MKRFISVSTVMVLLIACITQSEATPESRAAVLFLLAKPSTRSTGMGEAYVAVYDTLAPDAASAHYNPAMIAGQTRRNLSFTHTKWLPALANDMSYNFVGYTQPTEAFGGNVGLVIPYLNMGEQFRTDEHGNTLGTFSSYDFALAAIYGGQISKNMLAGISMKVIRSNLSSVGAGIEKGKGIGTSFAVDVGFLYHITRKLNFGLSLRNMGPEIAYIDASQADPLPQNLMFGVAYKVLESQYNDLLLALDLYKPPGEDLISFINIGVYVVFPAQHAVLLHCVGDGNDRPDSFLISLSFEDTDGNFCFQWHADQKGLDRKHRSTGGTYLYCAFDLHPFCVPLVGPNGLSVHLSRLIQKTKTGIPCLQNLYLRSVCPMNGKKLYQADPERNHSEEWDRSHPYLSNKKPDFKDPQPLAVRLK